MSDTISLPVALVQQIAMHLARDPAVQLLNALNQQVQAANAAQQPAPGGKAE